MKGLLFTYALTFGGSAVALFNPFIGLLIYIAFAILKPEALWSWSVEPGNYSRIIALALLVGWALHGFGDWNFGRSRAVVYSLLGFMLWMVASAMFAGDQATAWTDVEAKFKIVLPCMVGFTVIKSIAQLKQLAWVIMACQAFIAYEANMAYLQGNNWIHEYGFGGMDNNCVAIAMVCGAGLAFFLGLAEQVWWRRWAAFVGAGLMAHTIMLAESRGGMLGLLVTGGLSFVLVRKQPIHYAYLLLAVAVGLRMAGPSVWERFNSSFAEEGQRDTSAQSRLDLWKGCVEMMAANPLFGVGPHNFPYYAEQYGFTRSKEAHSLWMQLGAEVGVPGLAFLLSFYLVAMRRLWWLARELDPVCPDISASCRMVIAALAGFMVSAQFVTLAGLEVPYYVCLIGAGYLKFSDSLVAEAYAANVVPSLPTVVPLGAFAPHQLA
jgi:putative inorganic carbon (hco3(-)) transporter